MNMEKYIPPFIITNEILDYVSSIMEKIGKISSYDNLSRFPILRKQNRIRSIQSSCAIEANSLTINQVEDVINNKVVIGPSKDIKEIKNAIKAYEIAYDKNPFIEKDLKFIHSIMTKDLIELSGKYRISGEGVIDNKGNLIFIAPPKEMVPILMSNLISWAKENFNKMNPLILSSIFHYEFVFIHPFSDGNGRMARLWQNLILSKWKPIFKYIPIESLIKKYQLEYYDAISKSNLNGDSTVFVTFMLKMIDLSLTDLINDTSLEIENSSIYVNKLLKILKKDKWYTTQDMLSLLNLSDKVNFRKNYLNPAIELGLIEVEFKDKKTSKNQRYKLR